MRRLTPARLGVVVALLGALLAVSVLVGLAAGASPLPWSAAWRALLDPGSADPTAVDIVRGVRLPRVLLALLVGGSLSVAGVLFQALLRNPLADPFVLGVSGGAALGGVAVMSVGATLGLGYAAVPPAAFAGAVLTTLLLFGLAGGSGRLAPTTLLLMGVVFNAFASAAIVFAASFAGLTEGASIFLWLIGNLAASRVDALPPLAVFLVVGLACALPLARQLNLLALGEESAAQLGAPVERMKRLLLVSSSLLVGAAVAVSGLVGFVGLIVPHALRLLFGPDHRLLLPAALLGGASFLILCDALARVLVAGRELPVGAVTALLGGPLFLALLRRQIRRGAEL